MIVRPTGVRPKYLRYIKKDGNFTVIISISGVFVQHL